MMPIKRIASWFIPLSILFAVIALISVSFHADATDETASPMTHKITIERFQFVPNEISVHVGDTVEWVNKDIAPHTATATNGNWDSGLLNNLDTWSFKITSSEDIEYLCLYHPAMKAMIYVEE